MYSCCYYLPSYSTLLTLHYRGCVERSQVAQERAEEVGISFRESEQMVDLELFLDEYPQWDLGTPHWLVVLHKMFLHAAGWGQKEVEHIFCWGSEPKPDPGVDQSAMELVGYQTSRKEMRDIYHSMYLLRRSPGCPSCRWWQRRRAIQDILSSLTVQLQRWTLPTTTKDLGPQEGEWIGLDWQGYYEVGLWAAHQGALETAKALQSDIERLGSEQRRRSWAWSCSQSRSWSRTCSRHQSRTCFRGQSRNHARANSQSHSHGDLWGVHPWSPDEPPPRRRVSFHNPEDKEVPIKEEASCSVEPSIDDLEKWLEFQAGQLGTPTWWEELGAMPGIQDWCKFAWKIRASFYVLEVHLRASLEWGYTVPLAPQSLNRSAFLLERLAYQDVRQQPALLTIAYAQCLQHWVEKHNLPRNPDFCPWVEHVRELWQTVQEYVDISYQDVMQDLEVEKPETSYPQPKMTIFSQVLAPLPDKQRAVEGPPCPVSPQAENEVIWCTSPPPEIKQSDRYMLVVPSSVGQLNLGPCGDNARRSQGSENVFQNPQMSAVFPPPHGVSHYGGATLTELDE